MPLTENDFASIQTMVNGAIAEQGQTFLTSQVVKRDDLRKLVWVKELGDQPIPVIDFQLMVDVYSFAATNEAWHEVGAVGEPGFPANLGNYPGTFNTAGFFKDAIGMVHLKGLLYFTGLFPANSTLFTLPVDYRPLMRNGFACAGSGSGGTVDTYRRVDVAADGLVSCQFALNNGDYLFLDTIYFRAASSPPKISKRSENSSLVVPAEGATVLIAFERGTRRLPRCLGVIQSQDYIMAAED